MKIRRTDKLIFPNMVETIKDRDLRYGIVSFPLEVAAFFSREASMKSEKREKKNDNRKMKTPVYDGEGGIFLATCCDNS